ncbi:3-hydroxyanthranilate 3,4-dioxygenase [Colwellia chukchiensis]|uniref:3-hydroxyanthranilate 3,4-dioxygenase n=1 Tax=Colwellia chukchiensis TaxID=641665 RepID=A0A1H7GGP6_9GAMM|nr:3-hydroxyanthranilate 3,4-dioxygenase [Colwellia chukchiensis]SEK37301.1 3-hydroxyanthranilate 3,4-dioxygenase [Colwellia chukchiensis]
MANFSMPFNLHAWIDEHREQLKPPVCNKQLFQQDDYIVMVVGGPNQRSDFHYNPTPELFYQLQGEMVLKVVNQDYASNANNSRAPTFTDIHIKAGEIFMLPPKVLHSPQRFENSIGLVVEQKRAPTQQDALFWFCQQCNNPLYSEQFSLKNIETDLPKVFNNFYGDRQHCQCQQCGFRAERT